jgi:putative pyruvate formate lyase activating enzyme
VVSVDELVEMCLNLQTAGALNVNFVSATPFIPGIIEGVRRARLGGLRLPVVWNSSGYETEETVDALSEVVDVFLPDLKLLDRKIASRLFAAPDYPGRAAAAVERMISHGRVEFGLDETLRRGTLVRHLVLPGLLPQSEEVLRWCAGRGVGRSLGRPRALISLMMQFGVPDGLRGWRRGVTELENRPLTGAEYERLLDLLDELEIDEGYIQEPGEEEPWWPDFTRYNPFPDGQAVRVWPR